MAGIVAGMMGMAGCGGSVSTGAGSGAKVQGTVTIPATVALTTSTAEGTSQSVTIANSGTALVNLIGISITGNNASNFGWTSSCGVQLAPSASCTLTVSFAATSVGTYSASLNIQTDASGGTGAVALTGTATPHGTITLPSTLSIVAPTSGGI
jgi:opacity protein-like surface antigen